MSVKPLFSRSAAKVVAAALPLLYAATASAAIFVTYLAPLGITTSGVANLRASVNSTSGLTYDAQFEYGLTTGYGSTTALQSGVVTPNFNGTVSSGAIGGLSCGTTYHYRLDIPAAANYPDDSFTTTACPAPALSDWAKPTMAGLLLLAGAFYLRKRARRA